MNASQILERKGYSSDQINDILSADFNISLDMKVRGEFGLEGQPLHLLDGYYIGDADENVVTEIAALGGYSDYRELFAAMDRRLLQLADLYPAKCRIIQSSTVNAQVWVAAKDVAEAEIFAQENAEKADSYFSGLKAGAAKDVSEFFPGEESVFVVKFLS